MDTLQEFLTPGTYFPETHEFSVLSPFERCTQIGYVVANAAGLAVFFTNMIFTDSISASLASLALPTVGALGGIVTERVRCSRVDSGVVQREILGLVD